MLAPAAMLLHRIYHGTVKWSRLKRVASVGSPMKNGNRTQPDSGMLARFGMIHPRPSSLDGCKVELIADEAFRLSANTAVATLNGGAQGGSMGLDFWDCFIIILVVNLLTDLICAWTSVFGLTGLRMTTFR